MKLSPKLPEGEANGLDRIEGRMIREPEDAVIVVAVVDVVKLTSNLDTGDVEPTVRIRKLEVMQNESETDARELLDRAYARRTGREMLPLDVDPDTGEVLET